MRTFAYAETFRSPSPLGQPLKSNTVQLNQDPPSNGFIPMVPMFEVQSVTVSLGPEVKDVKVEEVNTSADDALFSNDNKVIVANLIRSVRERCLGGTQKGKRVWLFHEHEGDPIAGILFGFRK